MKAIIVTCLLIGLVAVLAPGYLQGRMPETGAATTGKSGKVEAEPATTVEVKASPDGHFYVDAEVNLRDVRFLVDTGATVVALRESDAASAGIRVVPADFDKPVGTANGTTMAAEVLLDAVSVGDLEVPAVRALIVRDDQLQISLLGGSFLNQLKRFEIASGTLVLEN